MIGETGRGGRGSYSSTRMGIAKLNTKLSLIGHGSTTFPTLFVWDCSPRQLSFTTDPSILTLLNRISDLTLAEFSVYKPYIVFFVLIDKFHHLLKVSELCTRNERWLLSLKYIHGIRRACLQTLVFIVKFTISCY